MTGVQENSKKCFEDFEEGVICSFSVPGLTVKKITEFASLYDPQRFHLDENEAAETHFGGLVASGFQTLLLCFRPFCEQVLLKTYAVGSPGIDNIRWPRPWYPGENLDCIVTVIGMNLSSMRNDRGYLDLRMEASIDGAPVLSTEWRIIVLTRQGANRGDV